jgi:hypothetical protein
MDVDLPEQIGALIRELRSVPDPRAATSQWKAVLNILRKTPLDQNRVANVVARRSVPELEELVAQLAAPAPAAEEVPGPPDVDEHTLASAMKAFRKRLKLTRLDDESQINSRNPLSKGTGSRIRSIQPPVEWPRPVWDALVRRGKLRHTGQGFYELADGGP